ncbi:hypothetical protein FKF61_21635 [Salmonella enterica]|uniref:Uncharacterized protein n=1 Tax=Salmonella phage F61 TaxID=2982033 RepID=A0A977WLJ5_9CAUD|nr:hypothetical protein [Salmonella enterica]UXM05287.1 hypothetical protein [Salmonella phage F115]UXM05363.1 hypothetical protein [Salmonella phage F61]HBI4576210.1 hypothetical protein [Salmonella enterica subsp. enterica serovar Infantis]EBH2649702.1 hypothetical protein [Salmonella enterica]
MILPEKNYTPHRSEAMQKYRYNVVFSDISALKDGETVYRIRDKHTSLLIGHTFHKSMWFDPKTLECHSIIDGKLLAKVERIK